MCREREFEFDPNGPEIRVKFRFLGSHGTVDGRYWCTTELADGTEVNPQSGSIRSPEDYVVPPPLLPCDGGEIEIETEVKGHEKSPYEVTVAQGSTVSPPFEMRYDKLESIRLKAKAVV